MGFSTCRKSVTCLKHFVVIRPTDQYLWYGRFFAFMASILHLINKKNKGTAISITLKTFQLLVWDWHFPGVVTFTDETGLSQYGPASRPASAQLRTHLEGGSVVLWGPALHRSTECSLKDQGITQRTAWAHEHKAKTSYSIVKWR